MKATTTTTNINLNYGMIKNVYGAGNEAGAETTNVNLGNASIINLYGGANTSGNVTNSNIKNINSVVSNDLFADFEPSLHLWNKSHLLLVYDPFYILFNLIF